MSEMTGAGGEMGPRSVAGTPDTADTAGRRSHAVWLLRWLGALACVEAVALAAGLIVVATPLQRLDNLLYRLVNDLGYGPDVIWAVLNPHLPNYLTLTGIAVAGAVLTRRGALPALALTGLSGILAWCLLEAIYLVYDRPRPEEVLAGVVLEGNTWAPFNSYPSGHMAVTVGLVVAAGMCVPALRAPLWAYAVAVGFTRVLFGAHFPSDILAGAAIGIAAAYLVRALLTELGGGLSGAGVVQASRAASTRRLSGTRRKELRLPS